MKKFLIVLVILNSVSYSHAQIENDKWSITGELMLPAGMGNKMFKNYLNTHGLSVFYFLAGRKVQ